MSKEQTPVVSTSKFSLVRKIVTLFKLGEEGKIESFFARQRKTMEREIDKLNKALEIKNFNFKNSKEDLSDAIEDAKQKIEDAYLQVDAEQVANNADADRFADTYWERIERAEAALSRLEKEATREEEEHDEDVKESKAQISERKRRLTRISAEK
jgi:anti-sigma28 factor (negative regulator of flagellin synthesis)